MSSYLWDPPLANLAEHPVPAGPCEEVGHHRDDALDAAPDARVPAVVDRFGLVGPVEDERPSLDVLPGQEPPVAAVLGIVAVVAHHEVVIGGAGHPPALPPAGAPGAPPGRA